MKKNNALEKKKMGPLTLGQIFSGFSKGKTAQEVAEHIQQLQSIGYKIGIKK